MTIIDFGGRLATFVCCVQREGDLIIKSSASFADSLFRYAHAYKEIPFVSSVDPLAMLNAPSIKQAQTNETPASGGHLTKANLSYSILNQNAISFLSSGRCCFNITKGVGSSKASPDLCDVPATHTTSPLASYHHYHSSDYYYHSI